MKLLNLRSGEHVLDVGAGIGGGDFYMAQVSRVSAPNTSMTDDSSLVIVHCTP